MSLPAAMLLALPSMAQGGVPGFGNLNVSGDAVPAGYGGFEWDNMFGVTPAEDAPAGGWANGVTGGKLVYNGFEEAATIGRAGGFTLNSGSFVAAWTEDLTVTAQGFVGTTLAFISSFLVGMAGARQVVFDWVGVTSVTFSSAGGTDRFFNVSGTQFGLDNLRVDEAVSPVPEPRGWLMMLAGFGLIGGLLRKRRGRGAAFA